MNHQKDIAIIYFTLVNHRNILIDIAITDLNAYIFLCTVYMKYTKFQNWLSKYTINKKLFNFTGGKTRDLKTNKLYRPVMEIKVKVSTPNQLTGLSNRQKLLHLIL